MIILFIGMFQEDEVVRKLTKEVLQNLALNGDFVPTHDPRPFQGVLMGLECFM